jgi:GNAT superfamily N-acetyltransferase
MSPDAAQLRFQPLREADARAVCGWRYEPPYHIYHIDVLPGELATVVAFLTDPANQYYAIEGPLGLEAFCCFGLDAQVPGGNYAASALDLGLGVRPDLTGQGRGLIYATAVIGQAQRLFAPAALRVTIAAFNQRAQRVWERAGFRVQQTFADTRDGRPFVVLARSLETPEVADGPRS